MDREAISWALVLSLLLSAQTAMSGESVIFNFNAGEQSYRVPSSVKKLNVTAYGAQGGDPVYGGKGGLIVAQVTVTPGELIYVYVGGAGFGHSNRNHNGWNGGGRDVLSNLTGGGGSDIRRGSNLLADRIVVAGGGGQRGLIGGEGFLVGGAGGGLNAASGPDAPYATGGGGGSQIAGGKGGCGTIFCGSRGDGGLGQGGRGDDDNGHGGGGYYGGGGGGSSAGLQRGAGGGGSSFVAPGVKEIAVKAGVRSGDGLIILTPVYTSDIALQYGEQDFFDSSNVEERTSPSLGLQNYAQSIGETSQQGFDVPFPNSSVGATFEFYEIKEAIVAARLKFRAIPLDDQRAEGNDSLRLAVFDDQGRALSSLHKVGLGIDGAPNSYFPFDWQIDGRPTHPPEGYEVTIDLANFASQQGTDLSLIADLAEHGKLDVLIGDDTMVDYVRLELVTNGVLSDADSDGVADIIDSCPTTPFPSTVDASGCAETLAYSLSIEAGNDEAIVSGCPSKCVSVFVPGYIDGYRVTSVTDSAFRGSGLRNLVLSPGIETVRDFAFAENEIETVILPLGLVSLGNYTFWKNSLSSISIPEGLGEIGSYTFSRNLLTDIVIPDGVTSIGASAFFINQLAQLTLPASVKILRSSAFRENNLSTLTLSDNLEVIGSSAFRDNALTRVVIPSSVSDMGSNVFEGNPLDAVLFMGPRPRISGGSLGLKSGGAIAYCEGALGWPGATIDGITPIADCDLDGITDAQDAFPRISIGSLTDSDGDGAPDECDQACLDSGMSADAFPRDPSYFEQDALGNDADGDGFSDQFELERGSNPLDPEDIPNALGLSPAVLKVIRHRSSSDSG